VAADIPPPAGRDLPFASLDDIDGIAELVLRYAMDLDAFRNG
jgi:hypothetical protein